MKMKGRLLITGIGGFLGKAVHSQALMQGYDAFGFSSSTVDLTNLFETERMFRTVRPDFIIHAAGRVGGIGANQKNPATFWRDNLQIGMNVLEATLRYGHVEKLVMVGTTCSYPAKPKSIPFSESEFFDGYPEETNAPYGIAKRALVSGAMSYHKQYGLRVVCPIPANLYGPGDNFAESGHAIPAIIRKTWQAEEERKKEINLWGTGEATRDFLYVTDCANSIIKLMESCVITGAPINIGTGSETRINTTAIRIRDLLKVQLPIKWDNEKPDGQMRRALDTNLMRSILGNEFKFTSLEQGLQKTVESFIYQNEKPRVRTVEKQTFGQI